jgi:hypothetical protein
MTGRPHQTIAQQLTAGHLTIQNSIADTEISELVNGFGYTSAKLAAGLALYTAAMAAVELQTAKAGDQQSATQLFKQAQKAAVDAYQALAKVARAAFVQDPAQLSTLGLTSAMPKDTAGFLTAAFTLFSNAALLPGLADYGYTSVKLLAERKKIKDMDDLDKQQEAAKGAAQQATSEQEAAMNALNDWVAQYRKVAKVALRGKKQLLEKIGIAARTSKTAAQRAASQKASATRAAHKAGQ